MGRLNLVCVLIFAGITSGEWTSDDGKYMVWIGVDGGLATWEQAFENCTVVNRTLVTIQDETEHLEVLAAGRVPRAISLILFCNLYMLQDIILV